MLRKHKSVSLDYNIFTYFECGLTWINYVDLGRKFSVKLKNIVVPSRLLWEFQKRYFKNVDVFSSNPSIKKCNARFIHLYK